MQAGSKTPPGANPAHGPFRPLQPGQVSQVRIVSRDGAEDRLVYEASHLLEAPNWTGDGALIVNGGGRLFRLALAEGAVPEPIAVEGIADANNDHLLSPDGATIYLSASRCVHAVAVAGGVPRRVSAHGDLAFYLHGISPDGATLGCATILRDAEGLNWGIATLPAQGGEATELLSGRVPVDGPEWTPDGAWIWFNAELEAVVPGDASLFRMRPDGSGIERMSFGERVDWFPHPDPHGELVAYLSYPPGTTGHPPDLPVELRAMPAGGGEPRTLARFFGGQGSINVNSWSPDGEWLAYVAYPLP
ncbi:PD40 domain-containing protein [Sphingomonas sp. G-3-2-10]|uniref:TolB family protein n=1 Tax=Sphingomonas sp. G-3-2-10 TaxID=2728838 RepID=UPI0019D1F5B4|nr:PD40 domain-containing protein [Sphingomonas sp. G-3-2-10]